MPVTRRHAFALIELISLVAGAAVLFAVALPALAAFRRGPQDLNDECNIRDLVRAVALFSLGNNDGYPRMELLDTDNATVSSSTQLGKATTGNLMSFLVFHDLIALEQCISPRETNLSQVVRLSDEMYDFIDPPAAVRPGEALWDPGFSGTPYDLYSPNHTPGISNQSYAHLVPFGLRLQRWRNNADPGTAIFANRGPQYQGTVYPDNGDWALQDGPTGTHSATLRFYDPPDSWQGYVGYNDGAVRLEPRSNPDGVTYTRNAGDPSVVNDNLFVDETDDASGTGPSYNLAARSNLLLRPVSRTTGLGSFVNAEFWID